MKFEDIQALVGHVPFISPENARILYDMVLRERPARILELGIAHGTATCYMAAALQELGAGKITAVDLLETATMFRPSVQEQLENTGLSEFVNVVRMQTGYTWFLHDEIARRTRDGVCEPEYDLCVIDGPKNWTIDGAAFFMADKLLKRNGWMIFDDYEWTYAAWDVFEDHTDGISHRSLSRAEMEIPHIREVFELLVRQHPDYGNFMRLEGNDWALAQKTGTGDKTYTVVYRETTPDIFAKLIRKAIRLVRGLRRAG